MKGIKFCLLFPIFMTTALSLSFQGQEEIKSNMIVTHEVIDPPNIKSEEPAESVDGNQALTSNREEIRNMRLYVLGALTEQIVAWFFQDVVPKSVMERTKRSLNIPEETEHATHMSNLAIATLGALLDREECRKTVICNACYAIKKLVPASQVAVVLGDHYLPPNVKQWDKYTVVKRVFLNEQGEQCEELYHCSLDIGLGPNAL